MSSYRANSPASWESTGQARSLITIYEYFSHLCYPEEPKTLKTAWEYYNEGALGSHITIHIIV